MTNAFACPAPDPVTGVITLAHGGGGAMTQKLLDTVFRPAFGNPLLDEQLDGAVFELESRLAAFTTDSFVVRPLFFPGGNIGTLAVNGTVNDLAMCGARPLYLSAGFIIEEGLPLATLQAVAQAMAGAARAAGARIVTGDTKVVERGHGDGLYINTAGIGLREAGPAPAPARVRPGDAILLSGDVGRHGMAVMSVREGLAFESEILSDCAPLNGPVLNLLRAGVAVHALRDCTRGGLATSLIELARAASMEFAIEERAIAVQPAVRGACELLGLDPLYVANEGRFTAIVAEADAPRALDILRRHEASSGAAVIGRVAAGPGRVTLRNAIGLPRVLDMLSGEQLPRIC